MGLRKIIAVASVLLMGTGAFADSNTWKADADGIWSGDWFDPGHWSMRAVPTSADDAVLPAPSDATDSYVVTATNAISVGSLTVGSATANAGCTATFESMTNAMHQIVGGLSVLAGGKMTHAALPTTANVQADECYKLNLSVGGAVTIAEDGQIDVTGRGYRFTGIETGHSTLATSRGPGICETHKPVDTGRCAGAHGGTLNYGKSYGCLFAPTNCGTAAGSNGGGAIRIVAGGAITLNGPIRADGNNHSTYGTGAGGSVWLTCTTLIGSGAAVISANGGECTNQAGCEGCGGRIALCQTVATDFSAWQGTAEAHGGSFGAWGQNPPGEAGTIYLQCAGEGVEDATVVIDNNGHNALISDLYTDDVGVEMCARNGSDKIGTLIVKNKAHVRVFAGDELKIYRSIDMTGGQKLIDGATVRLCGTAPATIAGNDPWGGHLVCEVPGKTLLFGTAAGDCLEITDSGLLTLKGSETEPVELYPAGDDPAKTWKMKMNADAKSDVFYVSVSNSVGTADSYALTAYASQDLGGNQKWVFQAEPTRPGERITWTGNLNGDWFEPQNWDRARTVLETDCVVIPATNSEGVVLAANRRPSVGMGTVLVNALTVEPQATLTLNGCASFTVTNNLTVAGNLTVAAKKMSTITCLGDVDFTGGAFTPNSSIFALCGAGRQSVSLNEQTFQTIKVRKDDGAIDFADGFKATVFDVLTDGRLALTFATNKTVEAELLLLRGTRPAPGDRPTLVLRSSDPAADWKLKIGSAQSIIGVDVANSDARGGAKALVDATSFDSGSNENWSFDDTVHKNATWIGGASGDFADANNWDSRTVPDKDTRVTIFAPDGEALTVTAEAGIDVRSLTVWGELSGTATLTSKTLERHKVAENVVVASGGILTHAALPPTADTEADAIYKLRIDVGGDMSVAAGGKVDVSMMGYAGGHGPGAGDPIPGSDPGTEGFYPCSSHGGHSSPHGGSCYGSVFSPGACGSGGLPNDSNDVSGGGAIDLAVTGVLTVAGDILANGEDRTSWGPASGGSILIACGAFAGAGIITADGGRGGGNAAGGGRVAIHVHDTDTFTGTVRASGGPNSRTISKEPNQLSGGAGTVYRQVADGAGLILVDNSNSSADRAADVTELPMSDDGEAKTAYAAANLKIQNRGVVRITESMSIADVDLATDDAVLDLGTNTLTVLLRTHKNRRGWADGATVLCTTNAETGVFGKIVWKQPGLCISIR